MQHLSESGKVSDCPPHVVCTFFHNILFFSKLMLEEGVQLNFVIIATTVSMASSLESHF